MNSALIRTFAYYDEPSVDLCQHALKCADQILQALRCLNSSNPEYDGPVLRDQPGMINRLLRKPLDRLDVHRVADGDDFRLRKLEIMQ